MAGSTSGRAGVEGPPAAVLERFAAGPRLVPVTFAWHQGTAVWAVDRVKPKRPGPLRRERDLAADPRVAMLVDHYDEDWARLWWVELQGTAAVLDGAAAEAALDALARRYAPPGAPGRRARWWR